MTQSPHLLKTSDGVYTVGQGVGVTGPKYNILRYPPDGTMLLSGVCVCVCMGGWGDDCGFVWLFYGLEWVLCSISCQKYPVILWTISCHVIPTGNLKQGKVVASIGARWRMSPAYMHSMAMTENYMILIEQPLAVSLSELLSDIVSNAPFIAGLKWHNEPVSWTYCFTYSKSHNKHSAHPHFIQTCHR